MLYPYRVEPLRPALVLIGVILLLTMLAPDIWRGLIAIWLSGPLVWLLLQLLRRRVGVTLTTERIEARSSVTRRVRAIPLKQIRSAQILPDQRLAIAYWQPRPNTAGDPDPRPPRQRVYVTAALADAPGLLAALPTATLTRRDLTPAQLQFILRVRRVRRLFYSVLIVLIGIPAIIGIILHIFSSLGLFNVRSY
jgi:hypothetical protein